MLRASSEDYAVPQLGPAVSGPAREGTGDGGQLDPLERLIDLVILLLEQRTPLTFAQIREKLPEGYPQPKIDSAKRMFERDKDVARAIGVPIEVVTDELGAEPAYRIRKDRFYLPGIDLSSDEVAALMLAVRGGTPDDPASVAVSKLLSSLRDGDSGDTGPSLASATSALPLAGGDGAERLIEVWSATTARQAIRFGYRASDGTHAERTVDPFRVAFRGGRWYLVGHDRDRDAIRAFRLSRFSSSCDPVGDSVAPPPDFKAEDHIKVGPWGAGESTASARIAFSPDAAWPARQAVDVLSERTLDDGWLELEIPGGDVEWLATWVLSFGAEAEVLAPTELRQEIVARLEASVG